MPSRAGDTAARGECRNSVTPPPAVRLTVQRLPRRLSAVTGIEGVSSRPVRKIVLREG
jgi:hypothetical protein